MKIIHEFFKLIKDKLDIIDYENICIIPEEYIDLVPYDYLRGLDISVLYDYAYKIGDRLLLLDKERTSIYARQMLKGFKNQFTLTFEHTVEEEEKRIRVYENEAKTNFSLYTLEEAKEKKIEGEEYTVTYCFRTCFGSRKDDLDVYPLIADCHKLIYILREIFIEYGIDLKEVAKEMQLELKFFDNFKNIIIKKEYIVPIIKHNKANKTILDQSQVSLLFYYLRENKFVQKDIDDSKYAILIKPLTGYSKNTVRLNLGKKPFEYITKAKISGIIEYLNNLITSLEKARKEIIETK